MSTVPLFAPDGSLGDIPAANVKDALSHGYKMGVEMVSPDGKTGIIPMDQAGQARSQGFMLTGSRATPQAPQPQMQTSAFGSAYNVGQALKNLPATLDSNLQSNTQMVPGDSVSGAVQNFSSGVADIAGSVLHPIQALGAMTGLTQAENSNQVIQNSLRTGQYVSPDVQAIKDAYAKGGVSGMLERLTGNVVGGAVAGRVLGGPEQPYQSPVISPQETQGTGIARAIVPKNAVDYSKSIKDLTNQAGNIQEYAQRTGNPLQIPLEYARAATGAGEEASTHFKQNIYGPNADEVVSVPPSFQGVRAGEGNRATIRSVYDRVGQINDLTRPAYGKADMGATLTGLEKLGLQNEGNALTDVLHNELASRTGLQPEEIAGLRQRAAQLFEVGNITENAVRARELGVSRIDEFGKPIPMTVPEVGMRMLNNFRGGAENIAAKNLRKALANSDIQSSPLPQPSAPSAPSVSSRAPIWEGIQNERPDVAQPVPDTQGAQNIMDNIKARVDARNQAVAANKQSAMQEFLHANDLQQAAQDAAAQRSQVAQGARNDLTTANKQAAMNEFLRSQDLQQAAQDAANQRGQRVKGFKEMRDALAQSRENFIGESLRNKKAPPLKGNR